MVFFSAARRAWSVLSFSCADTSVLCSWALVAGGPPASTWFRAAWAEFSCCCEDATAESAAVLAAAHWALLTVLPEAFAADAPDGPPPGWPGGAGGWFRGVGRAGFVGFWAAD